MKKRTKRKRKMEKVKRNKSAAVILINKKKKMNYLNLNNPLLITIMTERNISTTQTKRQNLKQSSNLQRMAKQNLNKNKNKRVTMIRTLKSILNKLHL